MVLKKAEVAVVALIMAGFSFGANAAGTTGQQSAAPMAGQQSQGQMGQDASSATIRQVQQALEQKGYDPGPADGVMGPRTDKALRDFQQAQNMQVTGDIDQKTMAALGVQGAPISRWAGQPGGRVDAGIAPPASRKDTRTGVAAPTK